MTNPNMFTHYTIAPGDIDEPIGIIDCEEMTLDQAHRAAQLYAQKNGKPCRVMRLSQISIYLGRNK